MLKRIELFIFTEIMNNHTTLLGLFILIFMNSCGVLKKAPVLPVETDEYADYFPDDEFQFTTAFFDAQDTMQLVTIFVSIEKQECYGICPEYLAKFYDNGRIELHGKKDIEWIGQFESTIDQATVKRIRAFAEQVDYFRLANYYPIYGMTIDEVPGTVTSVDLIYKSNRVTNKHHSPAGLHRFERYLEDIIFRQDWKKL
jgi:hypothetical protein